MNNGSHFLTLYARQVRADSIQGEWRSSGELDNLNTI